MVRPEPAQREGAPEPMVVHVVPHTHWDREWYEPFQVFRMRLVDLVDEVLEHLEAEPRFRFMLDGQLATVDDYLRIRPEGAARIRRAVDAGQLVIGPWLILLDEFLVSGETIVRNLQLGWRRAEDFGGAMAVGYLPDMFGHIAQMPQILRRAGIDDAVVWRGVPAAIQEHRFRWRAPDGSEVRAEFLAWRGYSSGAYLLEVPGKLEARIAAYHRAARAAYGDRHLLAMYGSDHTAPVRDLLAQADEVNGAQDRYELRVDTLPAYLAAAREVDGDGLSGAVLWHGELRSSARSNLLMGVTSARIDLKAAMGRAERAVARYAEPLSALWGVEDPTAFLELAWRRIVESSAHDSICGCSIDHVVEKVLSRLAEAEQLATQVAQRVAIAASRRVPTSGWVVMNPTPSERTGLVTLDAVVPAEWGDVALELPDGAVVGTQEVRRNQPLIYEADVSGEALVTFLDRRIHGRELFGRLLNRARIEPDAEPPRLTLAVDDVAHDAWFDVDDLRERVAIASASRPDATWRIHIEAAPRRVLQAAVPVPALGKVAVRSVQASGDVRGRVTLADRVLDNGLCRVEVAADGTLDISAGDVRLSGVGRLVDGGEFGDTYNHAPPATDRLVTEPASVAVTATAAGPVRGELLVRRTYLWPIGVSADGGARTEEVGTVSVAMHVELRADEPFVRVRLAFENRSRDHRLRFHVPLAHRADRSAAEGQFAVVERGLTTEGGYGELALPTFPAHGFVAAGGAAILLEHALEYELVDGRELALTVLRSTGLLSRNDNPYREDPAGPQKPVPGAQLLGPWEIGFAVMPHAGRWSDGGIVAARERYAHPFLVERGRALDEADAGFERRDGIEVEGDGIVLSAFRATGEEIELRLVREHPEAGTVRIGPGLVVARDIDLLGRRLGTELPLDDDGWVALEVGAWEIRTLRLRRGGTSPRASTAD